MNTRTRAGTILSAATAALLVLSTPALAAGPGGGGSGSGGSGGGGSGGGGTTTGSVYSDLVIALRAENGTPILEDYPVPETELTTASIEYCVQPVSYVPIPGVATSTTYPKNPVDGRKVWIVPLQGEEIDLEAVPPTVPPDFTGACDPQPEYAMYVSEVVLERLNLARTADEVIATKLADVKTKFLLADKISLDATGRINLDGKAIDASPENAAIYQSLMKTGTIPGLPDRQWPPNCEDEEGNLVETCLTTEPGPPATIGLTFEPPRPTSNSRFDAWELAAMNIGAAASKSTPLTLDVVEYYNRIIGFPPAADPTAEPPAPYESPWGVNFVQSVDPKADDGVDPPAEQFVDYDHVADYDNDGVIDPFKYNRSQTFKGSVTWLDVPTLKWKVSRITDVVPFTNLSSYADDVVGTKTLTGVTAFAQLADDVRALCNFIPDNTFLPGFYMDVPGVDTTADQLKAIHDPAVDLGSLPANVFQTKEFPITASLLNPWGGEDIANAQLRITIDAPTALAAGDVETAFRTPGVPPEELAPAPVEFLFEEDEDLSTNLVGTWTPDESSIDENEDLIVGPGYNISTKFALTLADGATPGVYTIKLDLISLDGQVLALDTGTINVNDNVPTVLWGDSVPKLATQGVTMVIPLQVYAPSAGPGELELTVTGPAVALEAGDVKVYGSNVTADGIDMVAMEWDPDAGIPIGTWSAALSAGYTYVTWYATVAVGAPVGGYTFDVSLQDGIDLAGPLSVSISAPESHGEKPPDAGDTTAPSVTIVPVDTALSTTVAFNLIASEEDGVTFKCTLAKNGVTLSSGSCTKSVAYADLEPGTYIFSATATDVAGNESAVEDLVVVIRAAAAPPATQQPPAQAPPAAGAPGAGAPGAGAPSATTPVVQAAVVKVKAVQNGTKLFINVNPNKGTGYWNIKVYRKVVKGDQVSWEKVGKTLRTKTSKETRTVNLGKGTYRVKVMEKYGMKGDVSNQVTLVR